MKTLLSLLLFACSVFAQTPDCAEPFQFTGVASDVAINNVAKGCTNWVVVYQSTGFSAISLVFQSAAGPVTPGTYGTYSGTTVTGSNPATNTTGGSATFSGYVGFARMRLVSATGTGTVTGILYGYKAGYTLASSGGSGGTCDMLAGDVEGTCDANRVVKVNGVSYDTSPSVDTVPVVFSSNQTAYTAVPDCDLTLQALNYDVTTHLFSCRTFGSTTPQQHSIVFALDGGGSTIATGAIGVFPTVAFTCTINRIDVSADQTGSITVDIWKVANAIPTGANKISASAPATLSTAQLSQNGSLSGWTTAISSGDVLGGTVVTSTTVTKVMVQIWCS